MVPKQRTYESTLPEMACTMYIALLQRYLLGKLTRGCVSMGVRVGIVVRGGGEDLGGFNPLPRNLRDNKFISALRDLKPQRRLRIALTKFENQLLQHHQKLPLHVNYLGSPLPH